jgi:hypothetical protein
VPVAVLVAVLVDLQAEADPADRLDRDRARELPPQRRHMHVQRLGRPEPVRVPDRFHDLLARHQRARLLGEEGQQVVLLGRERDLLAVQPDAGRLAVDGQPGPVPVGSRRRGLGRRTRLGAPHHRPYPRDDLAHPERLGDVVVGAELQADHPVRLVTARADHDDRHVTALAQRLADVQTVGVGQPEIEQHDVVRVLVGQRVTARGDPDHLEAVTQQPAPERLGYRLVVFHQEYAHTRN